MLWILGGLYLLWGLSVVVGASAAFFADGSIEGSWREWMVVPAAAALFGTLYLIVQWLGPAGGA